MIIESVMSFIYADIVIQMPYCTTASLGITNMLYNHRDEQTT